MWAWFCKSSGRWYVGPEWFLGIPGGFLRAEDRDAATPHAITATWELSCAATSSAEDMEMQLTEWTAAPDGKIIKTDPRHIKNEDDKIRKRAN